MSNSKTLVEYKNVVVIGNGPSGMFSSYVLSGNWPYIKNDSKHTITEYVDIKKSLIEHDLDQLSKLAIEGRSSNPMPLLIDSLIHPNADTGSDEPSHLEWNYSADRLIDHVVLGRGTGGGVWCNLDPRYEQKTLSKGSWMELPGLEMKWSEQRGKPAELQKYFSQYAETVNKFVQPYTTVCQVEKILDNYFEMDAETGERMHCSKSTSCQKYETRGYKTDPETGLKTPFCYRSSYVILATGQSDIRQQLSVPGENQSFVLQSIKEIIENNEFNEQEDDPVLVVGAGLSAADAVLTLLDSGIPVFHVFRRKALDRHLALKPLNSSLYPEYRRILSLMKGEIYDPLYTCFESHRVVEIFSSKKVLLENCLYDRQQTVKVRNVVVSIGCRPDLSFLPNEGRDFGIIDNQQQLPISARYNPIDIDPVTHEIIRCNRMFAVGALTGDVFVRFIPGAVVAIVGHLWRRKYNCD